MTVTRPRVSTSIIAGTIRDVLILSLLLSGLIIGALGRLAIPGRNPMGLLMTIVVGVVGSLAGGFIGAALHLGTGLTFVVAVLVAAAIVYLVSASTARRGMLGGRRRGALTGGRRGFF